MFKGFSKFADTDTIRVRRAVRAATRDSDVRGILLHVDSPGGLVDGTADLASDVRTAAAAKPVHAFAEDLMASAAYWVGSQADRVSATPTSFIGSIGVVAVVDDFSKKFEMEGVETHVVATGDYKGAFVAGAPIPEEHLEQLQSEVDDIHAHFVAAVKKGRGKPISDVREVADGRVHIAAKALDLGLIDAVESGDEAVNALAKEIRRRAKESSDRSALARGAALASGRKRLDQSPGRAISEPNG